MLKDKKTRITFHNGILTIGGTIIEIAYGEDHIFFDFGSEYNPSSPVQPTDLQGLLDAELLPYLDNMYDRRIPLKGYKSKENKFKNTAVFLSHVHLDHSKIINYLDSEIPLYTLKGTKSLLESLNINNDFLFPLYEKCGKNTRGIIGLEDNEVVEIGNIKVKVMPVDHDAYGACGMIIKTPDLVISYTGDIRLHGYRKNDTLNFCSESENADVLLIEGVSVSFSEFNEPLPENELENEGQVISKINEILEKNKDKQITFNYYISNVERIVNIIKNSSRTVVLSAYYAYVVKDAAGCECHYYNLDGKDYGLDKSLEVPFENLLGDEGEYLWQLDGKALEYMDSMKKGGIYIHSNASPLITSDPAYAPFMQAFSDRDIEVIKLSCSGHARPEDLISIINLVKPKLLVPIHSWRPEKLYNECGDRLLPVKHQTI